MLEWFVDPAIGIGLARARSEAVIVMPGSSQPFQVNDAVSQQAALAALPVRKLTA